MALYRTRANIMKLFPFRSLSEANLNLSLGMKQNFLSQYCQAVAGCFRLQSFFWTFQHNTLISLTVVLIKIVQYQKMCIPLKWFNFWIGRLSSLLIDNISQFYHQWQKRKLWTLYKSQSRLFLPFIMFPFQIAKPD